MVLKTLELTLISAKDLKNVNLIGKMDVYVVVHLSDDPKNKQKTPVHQDGGTNPSWNYVMRFTVDDAVAAKPGKYVVLTLKHETTLGADKDLGEVLLPLKELLEGVKDPSSPQFVTYQVKRVSSGKAQGEIKLSYKFIDMGHINNNMGGVYDKPAQSSSSSTSTPYPPHAYPPPPGVGGYGDVYPPPHAAGSVYPPPHSAGSVYPPPQKSEASPAAVGVPYGIPEGYPPQSHGTGYPPQTHGTGYPPQSHGTGYPPQSSHGIPYAAGGSAHGYPPYGGYPPQQPAGGYGYGYPPPGGYPPHAQTGYAQKPQKPKKNNKMGMGLGAGLLGGALGGLVLGEMMDDAFDVDCDF